MFAGRRVQRHERGILLSAVRSFLFNEALAERVRLKNWNQPLEGDVWMLAGSQSIFGPEPWSDDLAARLAAGDIVPTGPLFGAGELRTQNAANAIEQEIAVRHDDLIQGLVRQGLRQERRGLVLRPSEISATWLTDHCVELRFYLNKGSYATVILREIVSHLAEREPAA
jgi:tRNA pseudouridine13 synthase